MTRLSPDVRAVVAAVDRLTTQVARLADGASAAVVDVSPGVAVVHGRPVDTPTTPPDDGPRCVCGDPLQWYTAPGGGAGWVHDPAPDSPVFDVHKPRPADGPTRLPPAVYDEALRAARRQAPAADEDAQRTTRRQSLRIILDRASRGVILRTDEAALLRQHVDAEQRDADTARQVAAGNLRHVRMLYADLQAAQAERDRSDEAARRVLEQRQEMAAERYALQERAEQLSAVLGQVLREFTQHGHPGAPCVRTPWLRTDTVDRWRAALDGTEQPKES